MEGKKILDQRERLVVSDGAPWRITWAFVQTGCTIVLLANVKPVIAAGASSGATNRNRVTGKKIADVVPQNSSDHSIFSLSRPFLRAGTESYKTDGTKFLNRFLARDRRPESPS